MMRILIIWMFCVTYSLAQKEDYTWVLGYNFEMDTFVDGQGGMNLMFHTYPPTVDTINRPTAMASNSASICDAETGELLFYTNGYYLNNRLDRRMVNGDSLRQPDAYYEWGDDRVQASLILPWPDRDSIYVLIHRLFEFRVDTIPNGGTATELYYSVIDMREDGGLGAVVEKKNVLLNEYLQNGQFTACRHANGRDWWIVCREWFGKNLYVFLLDPSGVRLDHIDSTIEDLPQRFGRAEFSPNGKYYAIRSGDFNTKKLHLAVYHFDRCTGSINALKEAFFDNDLGSSDTGISFSPNSRFLYASIGDTLIQYDVEADDIQESEIPVGIYDGFFDPFRTLFMFPVYAPNGKIYVEPTQASRWFHTIHAPDSLGLACRVVQHDFALPRFNFTTTHNYPHFRLGPLDGSPCDTLGIDNEPRALFRYDGKRKHWWFTDLSYYEPESWYWEFGDGETSSQRLPVHDYDTSGMYEICLTVSNQYGQDTWCDSLVVDYMVSTDHTIARWKELKVAPNPNDGAFEVRGLTESDIEVKVFDLYGKVQEFSRVGDKFEIPQKGIFFIRLSKGDRWKVQKVIVSEEIK